MIAKKKAEIAENKFLDVRKEPNPIKFHAFAKEYLEWARANKKPSTCVRDFSIMRRLDKEFEGKNIQDITTWQIEKWKSKSQEKLKKGSVNREIALLKHIFPKAIEWEKLKENPGKSVSGSPSGIKRKPFLYGKIRNENRCLSMSNQVKSCKDDHWHGKCLIYPPEEEF